jgi:hypothetical protein
MNPQQGDQDPPEGLAASGRRLWESVTETFELDVHEQLVLAQACRTADLLDKLADDLRTAPRTVVNARGDLISRNHSGPGPAILRCVGA